ncbi:9eda1d02-97a9-46ea-99e0-76b6f4f05b7b [Thermothielavioides terrestris]|uniref:Endosomal/vacuolar adapter protein YPT35 n=1 Tax=Thermothielavioides terrestris TaxID=2587410 RepID=A0A446B5Q6_9PEZI|nr:9eda1d02-97a9-46ea-99e0-76b6f4f05b7b [Thermothielavioides terrestris]
MASETEQAHPSQQPVQQEDQVDDDNSSAVPVAEGAAGPATTNGAAQPPEQSFGHDPEPEPERAALFSDEDNDDNASEASIPSDVLSDQVTSPSVSVPPYWSHSRAQQENQLLPHPRGHARAVSSASVESVLPPGAITLQDNERDDDEDDQHPGRRSNSSEIYGRDRNRACWARSVQVTDYVLVNGSATNIGAFVVWHIRVETLNGSRMNIRKRYSEFDEFRQRLVQTFPNFEAAVPALPPKSVLKRFQPRFLEKRRAGLQYFLK